MDVVSSASPRDAFQELLKFVENHDVAAQTKTKGVRDDSHARALREGAPGIPLAGAACAAPLLSVDGAEP